MKAVMTITEYKKSWSLDDIEEPFEEEEKNIVVDMTDHTEITDQALRVEFRRTRNPAAASGKVTPEKRLLDKSKVIGLINKEALPREGETFIMPYHSWNNLSDFGSINSVEPVQDLFHEGDCYYFITSEGQWRLKVLDAGN